MDDFIIVTNKSKDVVQRYAISIKNILYVVDVKCVNHTPSNEATKIVLKNDICKYVSESFEEVMKLIEETKYKK
ncbi:MAG: hypothetical protein [Wendovervirus sonii]|uniref:Uncharacterized protein n=1 Tax=phage Lak_Megaphage_Sonny TaxID=3109229 RepID=A0ABZ0Z2J2_9CAUD|nr:MAG: hypothetical protein [phage Lak_Megaphage_Sonny]